MKKIVLFLATISLSSLHAMVRVSVKNKSDRDVKFGNVLLNPGESKPFHCTSDTTVSVVDLTVDLAYEREQQIKIEKQTTLIEMTSYRGLFVRRQESRPLIIYSSYASDLLLVLKRCCFDAHEDIIVRRSSEPLALNIPADVDTIEVWPITYKLSENYCRLNDWELDSPSDTPTLRVDLKEKTTGISFSGTGGNWHDSQYELKTLEPESDNVIVD